MATHPTQGGASASPIAVLPAPKFPRRAQRFDSMGEEVLRILRLRGETIPPNVVRLQPEPPVQPIARSPELALIVAIFAALGDEGKALVRQNLHIGTVAYPNDDSMKRALSLLDGPL